MMDECVEEVAAFAGDHLSRPRSHNLSWSCKLQSNISTHIRSVSTVSQGCLRGVSKIIQGFVKGVSEGV